MTLMIRFVVVFRLLILFTASVAEKSAGQHVLELHTQPLIAPIAVQWVCVGLREQLSADCTSNCTALCWGFIQCMFCKY